jgi:hypothetical protein
VCLIDGFRTKREALQFEWAVKNVYPRKAGGIVNRIKKLYTVCGRDKWTSKAPPSNEVPLKIHWHHPEYLPEERPNLPEYVIELVEG